MVEVTRRQQSNVQTKIKYSSMQKSNVNDVNVQL